MTLRDLISRAALLYGGQTAIISEGRAYTFAEQARRMYRLANALISLGLRKQERVAILAKNSSEYIEVFGAAETAGFIVVNLNYRLAVPELQAICDDSAPTILICSDEYAATAQRLATLCPGIRHVVVIGNPSGEALSYEDLLAAASDQEPPLRPSPEDIVYLIYTSGSTGRPKGVMLSHRSIIASARQQCAEAGAEPTDRTLLVMPLFHIGAAIERWTFGLMGGTIVLLSAFDVAQVLETIQRERITAAHFAPIMIGRILDFPDLRAFDTSSLRCVHYASAPMPVPLLRRALAAFGPIFIQVYGMTECISATLLKAHCHRPEGDADDVSRLSSAGQPFLGNEIRILRTDGSEADPGEIGEIVIHSPTAMSGYWNNTAATLDVLRDGWFYSRDLGVVDGHGFIYVRDRKKDMIISGGENIYSWEVEEALRTHPAVAEVAVIAVPDAEWGESVKACVVLHDGHEVSAQDLIDYCRTRIASYKKPRTVDFVAELPRLFNGKVDKKALRAPYWQGRERAVA